MSLSQCAEEDPKRYGLIIIGRQIRYPHHGLPQENMAIKK
jgi:hypothetical protein